MNYHMNLDLSDVLESLRKNASKDNIARTWKSFIIRVIIILINLAVTMAINIFYVYYVNQRISSEKRIVLQLGAAWLKLIWNVAFHFFKYILKVIDEESSYDKEGYGKVQLLSFLNVFNFVLAPVIAAVAFDSNCFKYVFFTPPNVTVSYNVVTPFPSSINYFSWDTVTASTISYQPPFIYNYQCTSTVLSEFTTVFVYKYTFSLFFLLVRAIAVVILIKYRFASDLISTFFIPKQLHFSILKLRREGNLWNPFEWIESRFRISKKNQGTKCYEADSTVISLIGDFAVLLTFGMVFPPLAVVVVLSILSQTVFHQLLIGRLVCELEDAVDAEVDRPDNEERWELPQEYLKIILTETEVIWEYFQPSVKYISLFSPIFLSFFLFDTMGDEVGFTGAIWILPLMAFTPLIDSVIYLVGTSCWMFLKAICIYSGLQQQASTSASSFLSKHSSVIPVAEVASDHEKSQKNLGDTYDFPAVPTLSLMNQDEPMKELEILEAQPTIAREIQATNEYEHHHIRSIRDQQTPSPSKSLETIFGFLLNNE